MASSAGDVASQSVHSPAGMSNNSGQRLIDYLLTRNRIPYYFRDVVSLARDHPPFLYQLNLMKKLPVHDGCVNTICWNKTGEYILSGSDDRNLCITKPTCIFDNSKDYTVRLKLPTRHLGNIFDAQFMPFRDDSLLVSCSSEGPVIVHDINTANPSDGMLNFNCHSSTIYGVVTLPCEDNVFLSVSEDKTLRLYDMRCHQSCARAATCPHPALIRNSHAMTTLSVHPLNPNLLLVGRADGAGLVYDRRKLPNPREFSREKAHAEYLANDGRMPRASQFKYVHPLEGVVSQFVVPDMKDICRFTSLCFSSNGRQVLASYSQEYIYLFNYNYDTDFELIQTLPKKDGRSGSSSPNEDNNTNSDSDSNNDNSGNPQSGERSSASRGDRTHTPRIRVRGDWSDTGQNSAPRGDRSGELANRGVGILQRLTEAALGIGRNTAAPVAEFILRPVDYDSDDSVSRDRSGNRDRNDSEEALRVAAVDSDQEVNNNNNENEDDEFNWLDEEEEEEAAEDSDDETMRDTIQFNVKAERSPDDNDSDDGSDDLDMNEQDESISNSSASTKLDDRGKNKTGRISSKTKAKFKRSFAGLKDRLSQIPRYKPRVRYQGHRNSRTSIKQSIFWGDSYIMSGSDCGRIMIWEKETAKLVMAFPADDRVVNCFAPNPTNYSIASSGIDYDIKLWATQNLIEHPLIIGDSEMESIVSNNELMLEEAKRTITVPPHLFFRVLASFAQNNARIYTNGQ